MFILQYIANRAYEINTTYYKQVIWVALDFKKAYDSIDRGKLIETMVKYKINPKIIDIATKLYSEDETVHIINNIFQNNHI